MSKIIGLRIKKPENVLISAQRMDDGRLFESVKMLINNDISGLIRGREIV